MKLSEADAALFYELMRCYCLLRTGLFMTVCFRAITFTLVAAFLGI